MTLGSVAIFFVICALFAALWQHLGIGQHALRSAKRRTEDAGVVLLDQSVVLRKLSIGRSKHALFALKRHFDFEFSTRGDVRYKGYIVLLGRRVTDFYMAPFRVLEANEPIDQSFDIQATGSCGTGCGCQR